MIDLTSFEARIAFTADTLGVRLPDHYVTEEGAPARALVDWCTTHGVSLDFLFAGDLRPTLRAASRAYCAMDR